MTFQRVINSQDLIYIYILSSRPMEAHPRRRRQNDDDKREHVASFVGNVTTANVFASLSLAKLICVFTEEEREST